MTGLGSSFLKLVDIATGSGCALEAGIHRSTRSKASSLHSAFCHIFRAGSGVLESPAHLASLVKIRKEGGHGGRLTAPPSEEDVLHAEAEDLERFSGTLSAEEAEGLLSTLTVGYLRLPLAAHFFADLQPALEEGESAGAAAAGAAAAGPLLVTAAPLRLWKRLSVGGGCLARTSRSAELPPLPAGLRRGGTDAPPRHASPRAARAAHPRLRDPQP